MVTLQIYIVILGPLLTENVSFWDQHMDLIKIEVTDRTVNYLKRKLCLIFPELSNIKIDFCWQGNVGFTRPQLPVIFENDEIYYAAGYAGSGTVWARWLGKKAAEIAGTSNRQSILCFSTSKYSIL